MWHQDVLYALCPACEDHVCVVQQMEIDDRRQHWDWGPFVLATSPANSSRYHLLCVCPCGAHFSVDLGADDDTPF